MTSNSQRPSIRPMLAVSGSLPPPRDDKTYAYEMKWDGIRAILSLHAGHLQISTRNLHDVTSWFPEIHPITSALSKQGIISCVLDGEIVALTSRGIPSFQRLQTRLGVSERRARPSTSRTARVTLMIFDILELNRKKVTSLPYEKRRGLLDSLNLNGAAWKTPPMHIGSGLKILKIAERHHLEGIIAKKRTSPYSSGVRSPSWKKIKLYAGQELVIGGYTKGRGARKGTIGALLVGYYDAPRLRPKGRARLHYAGRVGTGFSEHALSMLSQRLRPLKTDNNPFSSDPRISPAHKSSEQKSETVFVRPLLVGQFRFAEWTQDGVLRQPSFLGLRQDKKPREVIREKP